MLYIILFFSGGLSLPSINSVINEPVISFSANNELLRLFTYTIPGLALIWYLILNKKSLLVSINDLKPQKSDIISFALGFPGLILIGIAVSLLASAVNISNTGFMPQITIQAPDNVFVWIILIISCMGLAYLEESYFRFYLLKKFESIILFTPLRILFPAFLFALSHSWEGAFGMINAFLAGIFLSLLFIKYKSMHGISWAHGCYNLFVIVWVSLETLA